MTNLRYAHQVVGHLIGGGIVFWHKLSLKTHKGLEGNWLSREDRDGLSLDDAMEEIDGMTPDDKEGLDFLEITREVWSSTLEYHTVSVATTEAEGTCVVFLDEGD